MATYHLLVRVVVDNLFCVRERSSDFGEGLVLLGHISLCHSRCFAHKGSYLGRVRDWYFVFYPTSMGEIIECQSMALNQWYKYKIFLICMFKVWYSAVTQCFFSLNIGFGSVTMYASYNSFRHNVYRYVIVSTVISFLFKSYLGLSLHIKKIIQICPIYQSGYKIVSDP